MDDLSAIQERLTAFTAAIISGCEDCWIFMVPSSLGEVSAVCALSAAFKERYGGRICIVADQSRADLFQLFGGSIDVMKFADMASMRALSSYGALDPLKFEIGYPQNVWVNQKPMRPIPQAARTLCSRARTRRPAWVRGPWSWNAG